jgi:hypothetical protein
MLVRDGLPSFVDSSTYRHFYSLLAGRLFGLESLGSETSNPISRTNLANAKRESRSIAHSGRARGAPNLSSNVRPCVKIASRACSDRSNASQAFVKRRMWCESKSNSATTSFHHSDEAARKCLGGFCAAGLDFVILLSKKSGFNRGKIRASHGPIRYTLPTSCRLLMGPYPELYCAAIPKR